MSSSQFLASGSQVSFNINIHQLNLAFPDQAASTYPSHDEMDTEPDAAPQTDLQKTHASNTPPTTPAPFALPPSAALKGKTKETKSKSRKRKAKDSLPSTIELIFLDDEAELDQKLREAKAQAEIDPKFEKFPLATKILYKLWYAEIEVDGEKKQLFQDDRIATKKERTWDRSCGIVQIKPGFPPLKLTIFWEKGNPGLEVTDENNERILLAYPSDENLEIEYYPSTSLNEGQIQTLAALLTKKLHAKNYVLKKTEEQEDKRPAKKSKKDTEPHSAMDSDDKDSAPKEKETPATLPRLRGRPKKTPNGKDEKKAAEESKVHKAPAKSEQGKEEKVMEISEDDYIKLLKANKHLSIGEKLRNVFGSNYNVTSPTCKFVINIENKKEKDKPFKVYCEIEGLAQFRKQKKHGAELSAYGDKSGMSWIFADESDFEKYCPDYKPQEPAAGSPKYYEFRMWQLSEKNGYKFVKKDEDEIARGWSLFDSQLAEQHTIASGPKSCDNPTTKPLPGAVANFLSKLTFTLFAPKRRLHADSSYKKEGLRMRVWEAIKTGKNYYQAQNDARPNPVIPEKIRIFEYRKTSLLKQSQATFDDALRELQQLPLKDFYKVVKLGSLSNKEKLINLYNKYIGRPKGQNITDDITKNPFENIKCNLQELVQAVDKFCGTSNDDKVLQEIICYGFSQDVEDLMTKPVAADAELLTYRYYILQIVWNGYIGETVPVEDEKEDASMKPRA